MRILSAMAALLFSLPAAAGSSFDLRQLPVAEVVSLYYSQVAKRPYVICHDVLSDTRLVSVRAAGRRLDAAIVNSVLDTYGYQVTQRGGVDTICKQPEAVVSSAEQTTPFVYRPRHRTASSLIRLLSPVVGGTFSNNRLSSSASVGKQDDIKPVSTGTGQSSFLPSRDEAIVFLGTQTEIKRLRELLAKLDVPVPEVVITGYLYEVNTTDTEASAVNIVLSLLGSRVGVTLTSPELGHIARIKTSALDVVASALSTDSRFEVVTNPYLRIRSGESARLQVGDDVPVLGAIVTSSNGQASQSVEYRSSGVILELNPTIHDQSTDLDLTQVVSDFVNTDTSIKSPTLSKRELRTALSVESGEVLVVGGLNYQKTNKSKSGLWFTSWPLSRSAASRRTELVLVMHIQRV